ncbi:MAG TPA: hydrolase, partial [Candidatus Bathyarchaeia archaeon]|nr:hydrolase [Candidatus Bathyarchaeia archaeon]
HALKELVIIPGATHLFEAPGKLEEVARIAAEWFARHLAAQPKHHARTSASR